MDQIKTHKFPTAVAFIESMDYEKQSYPNDEKKLVSRCTNTAVWYQNNFYGIEKLHKFDLEMIKNCDGKVWFE